MKAILITLLASSTLFVGLAFADPVTLSWDAHPGPIAGFKVYDSVNPGVYGAPVATITSGTATSHTMEVAPMTAATTHYFTVTTYKPSGVESLKSNEVSKLISSLPVIQKPGTPVLTIANINETGIEVSWEPVNDGTGAQARVDIRIAQANPGWGSMVSQVCPSSPCTITGLQPGTAYSMQSVAWRPHPVKNVFGLLSNVVPFTTLVEPPPDPPVGLTVTRATPTEVIIQASARDCPSVRTSTEGSSGLVHVRTVSCVQLP